MIGNSVAIANKLEVLLGNVIMVPGCEPVSDFTSTTLAANMQCKTSVIKVADALCKIPGSTLEFQTNPRRLFFVLPSGPPRIPGCNDCDSQPDYYAMLRDICPSPDLPKTIQEIKVDNCRPPHDFFLDDQNVNIPRTSHPCSTGHVCNNPVTCVTDTRSIFGCLTGCKTT